MSSSDSASVSESDFQTYKPAVSPDERGRLSLGTALRDNKYRVLVNRRGQILLDPVVTMPASDLWLWENPALRESMNRALEQAGKEEFHDLGSFAEFATPEDDEA